METQREKSFFAFFPENSKTEILDELNSLNEVDKEIIELRFGLNGKPVTKPGDIAKKYDLDVAKIYNIVNNGKSKIRRILEKKKYKLIKENKFANKEIIKDKLELDFPGFSKERIISIIETLSERKKEVAKLKYGINQEKYFSAKEIAEKLSLKENTVNNVFYLAKKEIIKKLNNGIMYDQQNNFEQNILNCDEKEEIEELPCYDEFQAVSDVNEVIKKIKNNKFSIDDNIFICGDSIIKVSMKQGNCFIAPANIKKGTFDKKKSLKKECYIYFIDVFNNKNDKIDTKIIVKDIEKNKFYKSIIEDENGNLDFEDILAGELACYKMFIQKNINSNLDLSLNSNKSYNQQVELLFSFATDYYKRGDYKNAEICFTKLLKMSDNPQIIYNANVHLGNIYLRKHIFLLAEKYVRSSLEYKFADSYILLINLAKALAGQKKYDEALIYIDKADKESKKGDLHLIEKAHILSLMGNKKEALNILDNNLSNNTFAHYKKVELLIDIKEYDIALDELLNFGKFDHNNINHKFLLGKLMYLKGNEEESIKIFNECIESDKNTGFCFDMKIGEFFHQLGNEKLAYKFYSNTNKFKQLLDLSEKDVERHFEKHKLNNKDKALHSVINCDLTFEQLEKYISKMNKTGIITFYDVYQIYWPNIGEIEIDGETKSLDYLNIFTMPFTKKIMMCYPVLEFNGILINEPVSINELTVCEANENKTNGNIYKDDEKDACKQYSDGEVDVSFIPKSFDIPNMSEFSKNKDSFRTLINLLPNPTEQVVLLLKFGYVEDKYYTIEEISRALCMKKQKVEEILNQALTSISSFSVLTVNCVESARKILTLNK